MKRLLVHQIEPSGAEGNVLAIIGGVAQWAVAGTSAGIDSLSDVTITSPVTGNVLRWSGSAWVNATLAIGDVSGLQTALDAKAATSHSHAVTDLTATGTRDATTFLRGDNTWAVPPGSGGGGGGAGVAAAGAAVTATTGQTFPNGGLTTVDFHTTVRADTGFTVDLAANTITVAEAGWYLAEGKIRLTTNETTEWRLAIPAMGLDGPLLVSAGRHSTSVVGAQYLAAGTAISLSFVNWTAGSLTSVTDATGAETYLRVVRFGGSSGGGGATTLDALTDVDVSTVPPTLGQALKYDGTLWVPGDAAGEETFRGVWEAAPATPYTLGQYVIHAERIWRSDADDNTAEPGVSGWTVAPVSPDPVTEAEIIRDVMGLTLIPGANVSITPNDTGDTITITATGGPGAGGSYIAWDPDLGGPGVGGYPPRDPALPVTFVGPESPLDHGVMYDGDVWINTTDAAPAPTVYVTTTDLNGHVTGLVEDTTSSTYLAIKAIADASAAAVEAKMPRDVIHVAPAGHLSIDEFRDGALDPAWLLVPASVYPPAAVPTYTERGDVLSVKYGVASGVGAAVSDGASARHVGLIRPLADIGGPLAIGDAIVTCFTPMVRANASHRMSGLVFSTSAATSGNNQLYHRWWTLGNVGMRSMAGWAGDTPIGATDYAYGYSLQTDVFQRIVRLSATTWRGDVSPDGVEWILGNAAATWAFEPTHVGFAESNWATTTPSVTAYKFIRRESGVS